METKFTYGPHSADSEKLVIIQETILTREEAEKMGFFINGHFQPRVVDKDRLIDQQRAVLDNDG